MVYTRGRSPCPAGESEGSPAAAAMPPTGPGRAPAVGRAPRRPLQPGGGAGTALSMCSSNIPGSGGGGMRLPELCLALLCAATARTGSPGAAREKSPGPGAAAESGRGEPGEAALRAGGVDPRQAWMLLAGSPGQASSSRARGRTGTVRHGTGAGTAPVPASGQSPGKSPQVALQVRVPGNGPAPHKVATALEKLLRELQLLFKGTQRAPGSAAGKEGEGGPRAGAGNSGDQAPSRDGAG